AGIEPHAAESLGVETVRLRTGEPALRRTAPEVDSACTKETSRQPAKCSDDLACIPRLRGCYGQIEKKLLKRLLRVRYGTGRQGRIAGCPRQDSILQSKQLKTSELYNRSYA